MFRKILIELNIIFVLCVVMCVVGCNKNPNYNKKHKNNISIAYQTSVGYAPLLVMKEKKYIEEIYGQEIEIKWLEMKNGAAINEGIISGDIDVGAVGVPVAINGILAGCPYKIAFGISAQPYSILTNSNSIKSLKDITNKDQIGIVNINSQQHILLAKVCKKILGDAHALDNNLVVLSNPDGYTALVSNAISCFIAISPFNFMALKNDSIVEINVDEKIWPAKDTAIVGVVANEIKENSPDLYEALLKAVDKSMQFINENPKEAASIVAPSYDASIDEIQKWMEDYRSTYASNVQGILTTAQFMKDERFNDKCPNSFSDLVFENVKGD